MRGPGHCRSGGGDRGSVAGRIADVVCRHQQDRPGNWSSASKGIADEVAVQRQRTEAVLRDQAATTLGHLLILVEYIRHGT